MKKSIVLGMAFTFGLNSVSLAAGSRVEDIQTQTAMERTELRVELATQLASAKTKLAELGTQLTEAEQSQNEHEFKTVLAALGLAASGTMTALAAKDIGPRGGASFVFAGAFGALSLIAASVTMVQGAGIYGAGIQIDAIQKQIKDATDEISALELQLANP